MMAKVYYPRCIPGVRFDDLKEEREAFYNLLNKIKEAAIKSERKQGNFYDEVIYTMVCGRRFLYTEDCDYMIPYSIEEITYLPI